MISWNFQGTGLAYLGYLTKVTCKETGLAHLVPSYQRNWL